MSWVSSWWEDVKDVRLDDPGSWLEAVPWYSFGKSALSELSGGIGDIGGELPERSPYNPFPQVQLDLMSNLTRQAGIFGGQGGQFLTAGGRYDPNLAEALKMRAMGGAQQAYASALPQLQLGEASFREGQYQFDVNAFLASAEIEAGQENIYDVLSSAAQFLPYFFLL